MPLTNNTEKNKEKMKQLEKKQPTKSDFMQHKKSSNSRKIKSLS